MLRRVDGGASRLVDDQDPAAPTEQSHRQLNLSVTTLASSRPSNRVNSILFDAANALWVCDDEVLHRSRRGADGHLPPPSS